MIASLSSHGVCSWPFTTAAVIQNVGDVYCIRHHTTVSVHRQWQCHCKLRCRAGASDPPLTKLPRGSAAKSYGSQRLPPPDCFGAPQARLMDRAAPLYTHLTASCWRAAGAAYCRMVAPSSAGARPCLSWPRSCTFTAVARPTAATQGAACTPALAFACVAWMRVAHCVVCH